jgi:hypothetical protein
MLCEAEPFAGFLAGQKIKDGGALNAGLRQYRLHHTELQLNIFAFS